MISKLLIANRGEIACRVIRSARRMDIPTVAVYSNQDEGALHVDMADEAVLIGDPAATSSYLSIDKLLGACRETGADAVHPGYGFLSEDPRFARAVEDAGLTWVGPPAAAIETMGDKVRAKKLAAQAGVSTVPGHPDVVKDSGEAESAAEAIGYPVLLKAAAGGGGKGMRIVRLKSEIEEAFASAASEAEASFSDGRVFVEKYIEKPRHIEIQVLGDSHGNIVHLGERECSIQRRHQKVIEESPSPFVDAAMRESMGQQAIALAAAVGYTSAGTVEFMADASGNFYFLEMNTRLQVEHPVTELITGLDLVEWMLRVASGEKLGFGQKEVTFDGWALECRIYAEDPFGDFVPSIGRLSKYMPPRRSESVRVDSGVREGDVVSRFYDPLIAKVCSHGENRHEAISSMQMALDEFFISGVAHNIPFLSALMSHSRFQAGDLTTDFIRDEYPGGFKPAHIPPDDPHLLTAVATVIHLCQEHRKAQTSGQLPGYEMQVGENWIVQVRGEQHAVTVGYDEEEYRVQVHGVDLAVRTDWYPGRNLFKGTVDGRPISVQVVFVGLGYRLFHAGAVAEALVMSPRVAELYALMPIKEPPDLSRFLLSPMPGQLLSVSVEEGDKVRAGQLLAIVEAMKMENVLRAERDGIVERVLASPGDDLTRDQPILEFAQE